ncbi:unnamed protein product [Polarella glacialis]|uniref:RRM domain-containing protein n=1 Tax=Polarella glacialis TaxID=89957 RepID=A0A813IUM8_POLGL|nr:unnamed protein product [Polarella glacialis]CAE8657804.1 unnamed protein product [Polarella glacialis]|mmetsp:Transcript_23261/g.41615  ORF Transcript_23261/g.41615 Transcript_23261/m.41615 type:complete len:340 (+) Transcript_23261:85-1104(+)
MLCHDAQAKERPARTHAAVPRRVNLVEQYSSGHEVTTLMIRNVPNQYNRRTFMKEIDWLGFWGQYDFVYLPIDRHTQWNVGYAFVNFEHPKDAQRFLKVMDGHAFSGVCSVRKSQPRRHALVSVAHIQGLEQNLAHVMSSAVFCASSPWLRPWLKRQPQWQASGAAGSAVKPQPQDEFCADPQEQDHLAWAAYDQQPAEYFQHPWLPEYGGWQPMATEANCLSPACGGMMVYGLDQSSVGLPVGAMVAPMAFVFCTVMPQGPCFPMQQLEFCQLPPLCSTPAWDPPAGETEGSSSGSTGYVASVMSPSEASFDDEAGSAQDETPLSPCKQLDGVTVLLP